MFKLKMIFTLLFMILFFNLPINAFAATNLYIPIDLKVNDVSIKTYADPFLESNTTFVPIRNVCEALGVNVAWDANEKSAVITEQNTTIALPIGKNYAFVNGKKIDLEETTPVISDRIFVPVRFVAEHLNATVFWDQRYYIVNLYKENIKVADNLIDKDALSTDDLLWLARIIEAESSGEPIEGKIAVGNVILNRVKSPDYPNSIYDVIFDRNFGIQFEPVANGTIFNTPSNISMIAAKRALNGEEYAGNSLFFLNPTIAQSSWISNNRAYYTTISNHVFYL